MYNIFQAKSISNLYLSAGRAKRKDVGKKIACLLQDKEKKLGIKEN